MHRSEAHKNICTLSICGDRKINLNTLNTRLIVCCIVEHAISGVMAAQLMPKLEESGISLLISCAKPVALRRKVHDQSP